MNRCKNFFALGMCLLALQPRRWNTPIAGWTTNSRTSLLLAEANKRAMKAGYSYCEATEAFQVSYEIPPAKLAPGTYRNLSGNQALAMGFVVAAQPGRAAAVPGLLSHHAGFRHSSRTFGLQEFRRD